MIKFSKDILRVVFTGASCTGKTSLVRELSSLGCVEFPESGTEFLNRRNAGTVSAKFGSPEMYEEMLKINLEFERNAKVSSSKKAFPVIAYDGTLISTKAYCSLDNVELPKKIEIEIKEFLPSLNLIFFLDFLLDENGNVLFGSSGNTNREIVKHNLEFEQRVHEELKKVYSETGLPMVFVPSMPLQDRVDFVVKEIKKRFPWVKLEKERRAEA